MINELAVAAETRHKLTGVDHQHTDADQDGGQPNAEGDDQQQTETNSLHRYRAQKYDERRRTRNDATADTKCQQFTERNLPVVIVVMVIVVVVVMIQGMGMIMMMTMMMMLRVKFISPLIPP